MITLMNPGARVNPTSPYVLACWCYAAEEEHSIDEAHTHTDTRQPFAKSNKTQLTEIASWSRAATEA